MSHRGPWLGMGRALLRGNAPGGDKLPPATAVRVEEPQERRHSSGRLVAEQVLELAGVDLRLLRGDPQHLGEQPVYDFVLALDAGDEGLAGRGQPEVAVLVLDDQAGFLERLQGNRDAAAGDVEPAGDVGHAGVAQPAEKVVDRHQVMGGAVRDDVLVELLPGVNGNARFAGFLGHGSHYKGTCR